MTGAGTEVGAVGPTAPASISGSALLDGTLIGEQSEVTAGRGGRAAEPRSQGGSGRWSLPGDWLPVPGARLNIARFGIGPVRTVNSAAFGD